MNASLRWPLTKTEQEKLVQTLTKNLPLLRAKMDISQDEISRLMGISRQTYSAIESGKRVMSWQIYLSLVLFFDANSLTHDLLRQLSCYPDDLVDRTDQGMEFKRGDSLKDSTELLKVLSRLDEQGLHSVKTVLLLEYARCLKISGEAVVRSFDGYSFSGSLEEGDRDLEQAIRQIRQRPEECEVRSI